MIKDEILKYIKEFWWVGAGVLVAALGLWYYFLGGNI